ncbi:hypothetical protein LINPERPRIM_LOCUS13798 [Linum perenne]
MLFYCSLITSMFVLFLATFCPGLSGPNDLHLNFNGVLQNLQTFPKIPPMLKLVGVDVDAQETISDLELLVQVLAF